MNKYSDIEIQTAKNLLKHGFMWIARNGSGRLFAHFAKPVKVNYNWCSVGYSSCVCGFVPIFQDVRFGDKEPTSLESVVHPQILDDAERRYLRAVIRPFRNRVWYIMKSFSIDKANCYIFIRFNDGSGDMNFPVFRKGDMYKGMKICKAYTPEELGLV